MNTLMKMNNIFLFFFLCIIMVNMKAIVDACWPIMSYYKLVLEHSSTMSDFTCMFNSVIIVITSFILSYSISYMDKNNTLSYVLLMTLFAVSMLTFIMSTNIFSVMLGWDGLGVTSFLLVFFFSSNNSIKPSVMTILMNRVGDVCLIISILLMKGSFHSFVDTLLGSSEGFWGFLAVMTLTKSAQYPFSAWLPAAMAAPTPTSALVHSSTLVTAGVFLLAQYSEMMSLEKKNILMIVAGMTLLMASVSTLSNWDLKKIIALSTLSQMSVLFLMLLSSDNKILMNHMLNHATFKSLLFMSSGWLIYHATDGQEIRNTTMKNISDPFIISSYSISIFSLMGLPFSASYYSKHYFVNYLVMSQHNLWTMFSTLMMLFMTLIYSMKIYMLSSFSNKLKTFKAKSIMKLTNTSMKSLKYMTYISLISGVMLNYMYISEIKAYPEILYFKYMYLYLMLDILYLSYFSLVNNKTIYTFFHMKYQQMLTYVSLNFSVLLIKMVSFVESIWMVSQITKKVVSLSQKKVFFVFMSYTNMKILMVYMIMCWLLMMM